MGPWQKTMFVLVSKAVEHHSVIFDTCKDLLREVIQSKAAK